jgi:hypothetical protein
VLPPPVSGAAVGKCGVAAWVADGACADCVAEAEAEAVAVADAVAEACAEIRGEPEAEAEADADADADADGLLEAALADELPVVAFADELPVAFADELPVACSDEDRPPVGDGVRVSGLVVAPDDVSGVGVKVDGTEEPPAVQAETTTSSSVPAASRAAVSAASRVAAGVLSRIFMDPPRMRVRYTR